MGEMVSGQSSVVNGPSRPPENLAMVYVPTLRERFWRALGFRYHHVDPPPAAEGMPGWMMTRVRLDFSVLDRLRLLLTGSLRLDLSQSTNVQVDTCVSSSSWRIRAPGEPE